jgi:hypothetical protein
MPDAAKKCTGLFPDISEFSRSRFRQGLHEDVGLLYNPASNQEGAGTYCSRTPQRASSNREWQRRRAALL